MHQLLSIQKYEAFRKQLNCVYSSISNFFSQFQEVLVARINHKPISSVSNPNLAMFNLYSAATALPLFQSEYTKLFSPYSHLKDNFDVQETEALLTLVNIWRYVLDSPPSNQAIAYDAKQQFRQGENYISTILSKAVDIFSNNLMILENTAYIIFPHDDLSSFDLESEYLATVHQLKGILSQSIPFCSNRWYVETQTLSFAYVPTFQGIYYPISYPIPYYKLYDTKEEHIPEHIFPQALRDDVYKHICSVKASKPWINSLTTVSALRVFLKHYARIIASAHDDRCSESLSSIILDLIEKIRVAYSELSDLDKLLNVLEEPADPELHQQLQALRVFVSSFDEIQTCMLSHTNPASLIQSLDTIATVILLVQQRISPSSI